ncbi:MAG: MoaD/ThiS family protein [Nevskiaceae bacterium]|nr:MAG: MoaD/ThiS family protein [Nevskiaceae bacterium]
MRWEARVEITVELNGVLCRLAGASSLPLNLRDDATVADAIAAVEARVPEAADRLEATACAVGDALVARNTPLEAGDVLVLIPPVSGG